MAHLCRAVRFVTVFCISLVGLFISAGKAVRAISCHITCKVKRQENNSVLYAAHCVLKKKKSVGTRHACKQTKVSYRQIVTYVCNWCACSWLVKKNKKKLQYGIKTNAQMPIKKKGYLLSSNSVSSFFFWQHPVPFVQYPRHSFAEYVLQATLTCR